MPLSAPMPKTAFFAAISCCCCVVSFANAFSFFEWFSNWCFLIVHYLILNEYLKTSLIVPVFHFKNVQHYISTYIRVTSICPEYIWDPDSGPIRPR